MPSLSVILSSPETLIAMMLSGIIVAIASALSFRKYSETGEGLRKSWVLAAVATLLIGLSAFVFLLG